MVGIIVVFPSRDNAANIRNLLVKNGFDVIGACTTGAQAINFADMVNEGIIVCGYKFKDMMYSDLREYLPESFDMLLIASADKWSEEELEGMVGLPMPIKVYDLINTLEMMLRNMEHKRKKRKAEYKNRDPGERAVIQKAKDLLMERNHMTEPEAHKYLQKCSMDSGTNMAETAEMVLSVMS